MFTSLPLTVACVAAHPDDEVLLCGASLARHARLGHRVETLILAAGLDARGKASAADRAALEAAARAAAARLGVGTPRLAGLPDNRLDTVPLLDVVQTVEVFLAEVQPALIYTHCRSDLNVDHRVAHDAVLTAARPLPGSTVRRILAGETLSSTEWQSPAVPAFVPTVFHDVAATVDAKVAALEEYTGEIRAFPHPRSTEAVKALAAYRGAQSGFHAAEAFMMVRDRV
jgi:LmbE family N-acetylglucosaminyl deacetylase